MNIHYLSESTIISDSANSVHVMKVSQAFAKNGHDVTLHAYQGTGTTDQAYQYYDVEKIFKLKLYDRAHAGLSGLFWRLGDGFLRILKFKTISNFLLAFGPVRSNIKKDQAELVYSRNMIAALAVPSNIPFIFETHSPPSGFIKTAIERHLYRRKNCKAVVVISKKMQEIYEGLMPDIIDKTIVAHDAADSVLDDLQSAIERPLKRIGYVGQIYEGRGIDIILEAARALPHMEFDIVGGRPEAIEPFLNTAPDNVVFHGHQPHAALKSFFQSFDVVLAPYQEKVAVHNNQGNTSKFMSPLKIFEYMSCQLPIVCSNLPVLKEVLHHEINALLVTPDDPNDWVEAIKILENNKGLRESISMKAREDFLEHYTWKGRAEMILKTALQG